MTRSALRIAFVVASLVALSVALAVACLALLLTPQAATAQETRQEQRQNTPGQFDFYVLSLPWSPSFCASAAERSRSGAATGTRHRFFDARSDAGCLAYLQ
jgi:ribonuclease I